MRNTHIDKYRILNSGTVLDDWMCDINLEGETESNAGIESLIEYDGDYYSVITDTGRTSIARGGFRKINVEQELEEGGHIADLIRKDLKESGYLKNPQKQASDYPVKFTETLEGFEVSQKFKHPEGFDYHLVLVITDTEEASGDPELLAEGKWLVSLDLVPDFKDFNREHQKSILASSGITRREVSPEDIQMYGCSITCHWEQGDNLELIVKDLKEKSQTVPTMVGFYLDKRVNRIGETGWDKLEEWGVI